MPQIDQSQALTIFVGNMPTFIAVILAWMHSNGRISDIRSDMKDLKTDLRREIQDSRDMMRLELRRVEEVLDARLKHLEEHEN